MTDELVTIGCRNTGQGVRGRDTAAHKPPSKPDDEVRALWRWQTRTVPDPRSASRPRLSGKSKSKSKVWPILTRSNPDAGAI